MGNPLLKASEYQYGETPELSYSSMYAIEQSMNHQKDHEKHFFDDDSVKFEAAARANGLRTSEKKVLSKLSSATTAPNRK